MTTDEKIKAAAEEARRLNQLLSAPEPGLITWWVMLAEVHHRFEKAMNAFNEALPVGDLPVHRFGYNPTIE